MAIKKGLNPRFAEVGKIKIGGKGDKKTSANGKEFQIPVKYDHFVITTTERDKSGNYVIDNEIMKQVGNEPKEIPIRLLFDDIDLNFYTSFQYYAGAKLLCKGDGENAERTHQDGITKVVKCDPETCEFFKSEKCKVSGILSCAIAGNSEIGSVYRFRTHSWNSVSNILAALNYFSENTNGILQGLPLKLKMIKKATAEHGNVNVVTLVLDGLELMQMRQQAFLEYENRMKLGIDMKQLETRARQSGFLEIDHDTEKDIEEEFYSHEPIIIKEVGADSETVKTILTDSKPSTSEQVKKAFTPSDKDDKKAVDKEGQKGLDF